eukprot:gene30247-30761_t
MERIYKSLSRAEWTLAQAAGVFEVAAVDHADGFIHFSTGEQAIETAARHFEGQEGLLLVAIDGDALGEELVFEPSRGGALFPHLYAPLFLSAVLWEKPLPLGADGPAHGLSIKALKTGLVPSCPTGQDKRLAQTVAGLVFPNPLGMAAGYDKNAE